MGPSMISKLQPFRLLCPPGLRFFTSRTHYLPAIVGALTAAGAATGVGEGTGAGEETA